MKDSTKKLLYNPMAAEFGIDSMAQMNDFIRNEMTRFKMVSGNEDQTIDRSINRWPYLADEVGRGLVIRMMRRRLKISSTR